MPRSITYDDKMAFVTDYISKLPSAQQVALLQEAPAEMTMAKTVDYLYARIASIVASNNPGLRSNQPEQAVPNALRPTKPVEESNRGATGGVRGGDAGTEPQDRPADHEVLRVQEEGTGQGQPVRGVQTTDRRHPWAQNYPG